MNELVASASALRDVAARDGAEDRGSGQRRGPGSGRGEEVPELLHRQGVRAARRGEGALLHTRLVP